MTVTIKLNEQEAAWLSKRVKGGLRKKNRQRRALILQQLAIRPAANPATVKSSATATSKGKSHGRNGMMTIGTTMHAVLAVYATFPDGLTALEAAELSGRQPQSSAIAATSDHKRHGYIRVIGVKNPGSSNVLAITNKGLSVLRNAKKAGA